MFKMGSACLTIRFPLLLTLMTVPLAASADCNWGGGASTPQSVFDQSCRQQGGVPHGCVCGAPGSGNSGNSNYDNGAAQRAQAAAEAAAAAQRQRDAELAQQRVEADSKRRIEEIANQAKFIDDRDAAANTLRGSIDSTTSARVDNSGLRGTSTGITSELRGAQTVTPSSDPMVVDARHVSSGLPKAVDNAIASGYASAPPGVGDRVRKGFQAVATHDWKLARAWFQDALIHDPNNAGLKRLVELADYTEKRSQQVSAGETTQHPSLRSSVELPQDSDMALLFPDLKPAPVKPSSAHSGKQVDLPKDSDIEFLFPDIPAIQAKTLNEYILDQAIKNTMNDPELIQVSNRLGNKQHKIPKN